MNRMIPRQAGGQTLGADFGHKTPLPQLSNRNGGLLATEAPDDESVESLLWPCILIKGLTTA